MAIMNILIVSDALAGQQALYSLSPKLNQQ